LWHGNSRQNPEHNNCNEYLGNAEPANIRQSLAKMIKPHELGPFMENKEKFNPPDATVWCRIQVQFMHQGFPKCYSP
jgi:hypothetical protein